MLFALLATAFAADPCAKAKSKVDKATGETVVTFKGNDWKVLHTSGGVVYQTKLHRDGATSYALKTGEALDAKLANGEAVRMSVKQDAEARSHTSETGSFTQWEAAFSVPADSVEKLGSSPMKKVRVNLGAGAVVTEVGGPKTKKIQQAFECISELDESEVSDPS